jgi:hypothetical protein
MTNGTLLPRKCSNSHLTSLTNFEGWKVKLTPADAFPRLAGGQAFPTPRSGSTERRSDGERLSHITGLWTLQPVCLLLTPESDFY